MAVRDPADIRNICFCGHNGCGKTTLTERLLHDSGVIGRLGTVEEGSTVSDWTEEEKHHKYSLQPSVVHFEYEGHLVNLIDTPGMSDFIGHAIACFPAVETVAIVIDAHKGVESSTRRLFQVAQDRKLPTTLIVNKIDSPEADLEAVTERLRAVFGAACLPINLPTADRSDVVDVFESEESAETAFSSPADAHTQIVEQVVEVDEDLMEQYLEKGADGLNPHRVHAAFEQALREGHLVPIVYCSARSGAGIAKLLHFAASLLPSPLEGNPRPFVAAGVKFHAEPEADKPTIAHVFKVSTDKHVGKLGVFRVHQGTVKPKSELYIDDERKPVRIAHIMRVQGKEHDECEVLGPGEIGAVAKIDEVVFNGVLHSDSGEGMHLDPLPLPQPMFGLAIELTSHADEAKFSTAMQKLTAEDPCLTIERSAATRQTVMRGLGELHLRVVLERLEAQYGIKVETSQPKVAYKETIAGKADGHHRHKKQTGGAGQFGEVYLRVAPLPPGSENGFEFENATVGGSIPRQFMPAIEKGIRQTLSDGAFAGYPLTGVRVEVYDGKHHDVDSKEIAFITAGRKAFIDAIKRANPVLLEPFVEVEVTAPAEFMGDITGDLSTKRARVNDTTMVGSDTCIVKAVAPLGELQNYATELKSITGGAGSFVMNYSHDEQTPPHIQQEVIAAFKPRDEED